MKVMLVLRLYSHLVNTLAGGRWAPEGMPAVYKLVEGLNRAGIQTDVLLLCKNPYEQVQKAHAIRFDELENTTFYMVPYKPYSSKRLELLLNGWYQFRTVWQRVATQKYDLFYCDRANITFAALLAWLNKTVVIRLHGVATLPETLKAREKKWLPSIQHWSFRAPFKYVICSKDGSPGKYFMASYMNGESPKEVLFNGVDPVETNGLHETLRGKYRLSPDTRIILTIGNLQADKSSNEFIDAIVELKKSTGRFFVIFVGDGVLRDHLESRVKKQGLTQCVAFTGRIPHGEVYTHLTQSDIFVSLNRYGNLSNSVLEAMNAGKCIVALDKCRVSQRDEHLKTDPELKQALTLIDRENLVEELTTALTHLLEHPLIIREKAGKIRAYAQKTLTGWDTRIVYEIQQLRRVADKHTRAAWTEKALTAQTINT